MKITAFDPIIVTTKSDEVMNIFEELGFEKRHRQENIGEKGITGIRMKDAEGFYVDISQSDAPIPNDMVSIRMNVDNFEEAYDLLIAHGFKNYYGDQSVNAKTSKSAIMISPSGYVINLIHHIK